MRGEGKAGIQDWYIRCGECVERERLGSKASILGVESAWRGKGWDLRLVY